MGHTQTSWASWLPVVQFALNNSRQESVQHTPFYLNHGRHPNLPSMVDFPNVGVPDAKSFTERMQNTLVRAKHALDAAQQRMVKQAKKHRRDVTYQVGDQVLLSTKNLRPAVGAKKLMPKYVGPFEVIALHGPVAVKLLLTDGFERLHDVFHVSLIKPYKVRDQSSPIVVPVPLNHVDGLPAYEVEAILAHQAKQTKSRKRKEVKDRVRCVSRPIISSGKGMTLTTTLGSPLPVWMGVMS